MIRLNIEEYCHECPLFDPKKDATYTRSEELGVMIASDNSICCSKFIQCEHIAKYLKAKFEKEKGNESER